MFRDIEPGEDFSLDMARRAIATGDHEIEVLTFLNDELSGGMTYPLSFEAQEIEDPKEEDPPKDKPCRPLTIEEIMKILCGCRRSPTSKPITDNRIRAIRKVFDMFDDD